MGLAASPPRVIRRFYAKTCRKAGSPRPDSPQLFAFQTGTAPGPFRLRMTAGWGALQPRRHARDARCHFHNIGTAPGPCRLRMTSFGWLWVERFLHAALRIAQLSARTGPHRPAQWLRTNDGEAKVNGSNLSNPKITPIVGAMAVTGSPRRRPAYGKTSTASSEDSNV